MSEYPIDLKIRVTEIEKRKGSTASDSDKEFLALMTKKENDAYEQGCRDGFVRSFPVRDEEPQNIPEQYSELVESLLEFRAMLIDAYDESEFDQIMKNLGPPPSGSTLGEKIYCMMREAFISGGVYVLCRITEEAVEKEDGEHGRQSRKTDNA